MTFFVIFAMKLFRTPEASPFDHIRPSPSALVLLFRNPRRRFSIIPHTYETRPFGSMHLQCQTLRTARFSWYAACSVGAIIIGACPAEKRHDE